MTDLSKEYGTALFMLACEKNQKNEYALALNTISDAFKNTPEYMEFLYSPSISMKERLESLEKILSGKIPEDVLSYVQLLCEKGRIKLFFDSVEAYKLLLSESEKIIDANVTSAVELTDAEKNKLETKLEKIYKSKVKINYVVDASIVGGIIVETEGKILDGSIKNRLRDIKEVISK